MFSSYRDLQDNIYYNITISNNVTTTQPIEANFSENRTVPLLLKQSDYKLEILKFTIPTTAIPMFIYNDLGYVGFEYNDGINPPNFYSQQVLLTNLNVPPGAPQTIENNTPDNSVFAQKYGLSQRSVYNYQQFLVAINYALSLVYQVLVTAHPSVTQPVPYFAYNNSTKLFSLICANEFDTLNPSFNNVHVHSNYDIYRLFNTLPIYFNTSAPSTSIQQIQYLVYDVQTNHYSPSLLEMIQQSSSISNWFLFKNIYLVSNNISVNQVGFGQLNGVPITFNVVAGFSNLFTTSLDYNTTLEFLQVGTKDQIDLLSDDALYTIDFKLVMQDIYGKLYPILLSTYDSFNVVVKFKKIKPLSYLLNNR